MDDIVLPEELQQQIQAVLREHNEMPKQTLMDHVIAMRHEIERLRSEAGISPAETKAATAAAIRAAVEEVFKSRVS